ncbi:uncharacterized protein HD556DRAFT_1448727 [Suillus plorans]|uniref:Uncharacterized protein n=1 Tax=Suillus plorans TaxID=116603 RepID=A0A9P7AFS2_9AGAM|nr:uncharacterized protein HD556DRAFT_1448727 [Suillus plorans]KAG1787537.1 hypothetical protein HD556DRAFT_1448727 [Suillus plorans]
MQPDLNPAAIVTPSISTAMEALALAHGRENINEPVADDSGVLATTKPKPKPKWKGNSKQAAAVADGDLSANTGCAILSWHVVNDPGPMPLSIVASGLSIPSTTLIITAIITVVISTIMCPPQNLSVTEKLLDLQYLTTQTTSNSQPYKYIPSTTLDLAIDTSTLLNTSASQMSTVLAASTSDASRALLTASALSTSTMPAASIVTKYNFQILETLRVCFARFIAPLECLFDDGGLAFLDLEYAAFNGVIDLEEGLMTDTTSTLNASAIWCVSESPDNNYCPASENCTGESPASILLKVE